MDSADFRSMFPTSFGEKNKKKKVINIAEKNKRKAEKEPEKEEEKPKEEEEGDYYGPLPAAEKEEPEEPEPSSTSVNYERFKLPVSHEAVLHGHTKAVSALALDRKGARILSGSYDCTVKMWDLHGMNHSLQSFRSIEPEEGNHIRQLQYSISGDRILCCTGSNRPKIFDREGVELCQFVRGDMYITDLQHTYGHVTEVTQGWWHPTEVDMIITSSGDGTIRIWDVNYPRRNREVLKLKDKAAKRTNVTCCAYSEDGEMIAGAGRDGSIQVFSSKCWTRPLKMVRDAHQPETETSSLTFANDDVTLLSRGGDHTLKVWDLRRFREPLKEWADLDNFYHQTDAIFSPNEDVIVTGTSHKAATKESKGQGGRLVFFSRQRLAKIASVNITDQSVIRTVWHPDLNQIFIGGSDNEMRILFNPDFSKRGALLCVGKQPRRKDATDFIDFMDVSNPHALPMFAEPTRKKPRYDPRKSKTPYKPKNDTPGKGIGGALAPLNLTAHFMKQMVSKQILTKDQDPRAEILKYADKAAADPKYLGRAYSKTQPKPIFLDKDLEEEDERDARLQAIASEVDKKDNKKNYTYGQNEKEIERRRRERSERDF